MASSPRDGQTLDLPPVLIRYIKSLDEPIEKYSPYFDALFIRRRNHQAFFQDLKDFRCQEHIIALLTSRTLEANIKELYRSCSRLFLESRFAHPWCRSTPSSNGWFKAEWGGIMKQSEAKRKDEQRLHKLLVPIWCGFRVRMMPKEEQIEKFVKREEEIQARIPMQLGLSEAAEKSRNTTEQAPAPPNESKNADTLSESTKKTRRQTMGDLSTPLQAEAFVSEEDGHVHEQQKPGGDDGAAAVAKLFVGVAATSFLAKNPRARKYLWKKLQK